MKLTTLTYRYEERRSSSYQSAAVAVEATVAVEDGDDRAEVFRYVRNKVRAEVRQQVNQAIAEITGSTAA